MFSFYALRQWMNHAAFRLFYSLPEKTDSRARLAHGLSRIVHVLLWTEESQCEHTAS